MHTTNTEVRTASFLSCYDTNHTGTIMRIQHWTGITSDRAKEIMNLSKSPDDEYKDTPQSFQSPFGDNDRQEHSNGAYSIPANYVSTGSGNATPKTAPKGCAIGCLAVIVIFVILVIASIVGSSDDDNNIASESNPSAVSQPAEELEPQPESSSVKSTEDASQQPNTERATPDSAYKIVPGKFYPVADFTNKFLGSTKGTPWKNVVVYVEQKETGYTTVSTIIPDPPNHKKGTTNGQYAVALCKSVFEELVEGTEDPVVKIDALDGSLIASNAPGLSSSGRCEEY